MEVTAVPFVCVRKLQWGYEVMGIIKTREGEYGREDFCKIKGMEWKWKVIEVSILPFDFSALLVNSVVKLL